MNNTVLIGRLTTDVELRYSAQGTAFTRFAIAVDRGMSKEKREEAESLGRQTADFISIVVFGKQAENCHKFLAKGRNVAVQGRIQAGSYTAADGSKNYYSEVLATQVQFIEWGDNPKKENVKPFGEFDLPYQEENDEEIPF